MACTPIPTKTLYEPSLSTTFSPSVSSLPGSVMTVQSTECVATAEFSDNSTTCVSTITVEQLSTVAGGQTTIQVPIVVTLTAQPTQTLYAQCRQSDTISPHETLSTPQASTRPSRSVVYTTVIVTSSPAPVTVTPSPTTSSTVISQVQNGGRSYARLGPEIGGTLGGVVVVTGLVGLVWRWMRRRKSWDAMFEKGIDSNPYSNGDFNPSRFSQGNNGGTRLSNSEFTVKPKPYTYGIVGISRARTSSISFGSPRGSTDRTQFERSYDPYQDTAPTLPSVEPVDYFDTRPSYGHSRQTSTAPLLYTPFTFPTTHKSPEPSIAPSMLSSYSALQDLNMGGITRPSPARAPSGGSVSRPHTGGSSSIGSRPSTGSSGHGMYILGPTQLQLHKRTTSRNSSGSVSRPHTGGSSSLGSRPSTGSSGHGMHIPGPTQQQQLHLNKRPTRRNSNNPDEHQTEQRPNSGGGDGGGRPISPRTLMLANWNPSTDAILLDADSPPPAVAPPEYREGRASQIGRAL